MKRRNFIKQVPALASLLMSIPSFAQESAKKTILLRSAWQTVNIGDIGHTPGVLRLLEQYLPDVEVRLWPFSIDQGVEGILLRRFPKLTIINTPEKIETAFRECAFMLHGSGPALLGRKEIERWRKETNKPYGVYGITFPGVYSPDPRAAATASPLDIELLSNAKFAFFRDSISLAFAKEHGVTNPVMEFCPDGAFAVDLRNDKAAIEFLNTNRLVEGNFLCVIPRKRFTPYWEIPDKKYAVDEVKYSRNEAMLEHDNAPIREAIIAVVRQTSMKILICPEDETQVKLGKEILFDKLPEDVKPKVVWRDRYWITDEAVSTYVRSAGLFGLEMHSPIMCIGNGVPALVGRFFEQTSKGVMWKDIGLEDWLFDMDNEQDVARLVPTVLSLVKDSRAAKARALKAKSFVEKRQKETMEVVKRNL